MAHRFTEIIFEVTTGGLGCVDVAHALGYDISACGDDLKSLRANVGAAIRSYFGENANRPRFVRLHFVREELLPLESTNDVVTADARAPGQEPQSIGVCSEIMFDVTEDVSDGGYIANALEYGIVTDGDTLDELRSMVKDAVACYFDDGVAYPQFARLHFWWDDVLAV